MFLDLIDDWYPIVGEKSNTTLAIIIAIIFAFLLLTVSIILFLVKQKDK